MEPAFNGPLLGGVYFDKEAMAEPFQTVLAMAQEIRANGGEIIENCELKDLVIAGNKVEKVITSQGEIHAKQVIMATGGWSKDLSRLMRLRVPILGGKGYSMIVPKLEKQPQYPIMVVEKKLAITPRQNSLRIAGTLELVDQDFSVTKRRVEIMKRGARGILSRARESGSSRIVGGFTTLHSGWRTFDRLSQNHFKSDDLCRSPNAGSSKRSRHRFASSRFD